MIFHHHKIIFVGIPKNGSTSIWKALHDVDGPMDDEDSEGLEHNIHNHARIVDECLFPYEKMCMVRDPYTRVLSSWFWWTNQIWPACKGRMWGEIPTLNEYLKWLKNVGPQYLTNLFGPWEPHFKPQWWYVTINGKNVMDRILKLENPSDWDNLRNDYPNIRPLDVMNKMDVDYISPQLDEESIQLINHIYWDDFKMFNYEMRNQ